MPDAPAPPPTPPPAAAPAPAPASAEARIRTDRASRYLTQLCRHTRATGARHLSLHRFRHHRDAQAMPGPRHAEWTDTEGAIDFEHGRCTLRAAAGELVLHVEAADEQQSRRIQDGIGDRLRLIGHRDQLTVTWIPLTPSGQKTAAP